MWTVVTPIFHQRDLGTGITEYVIVERVYGSIEPVVHDAHDMGWARPDVHSERQRVFSVILKSPRHQLVKKGGQMDPGRLLRPVRDLVAAFLALALVSLLMTGL